MVEEYKNIQERHLSTLDREVNKLIQEGWQPLGRMSYSRIDIVEIFHQTMVKTKTQNFSVQNF